jgi:2-methylcitrate dehydratase PrpD
VPTPLEAAASWAAGQHIARLPDEAVRHGKRAILDWTGAALAGGALAPARLLATALARGNGGGRAQLVTDGRGCDLRTAALVNGTAAHTAEVDDIFRDGIYHPGAPTIAAALAAAQERERSGAELLTAVVVGFEVSTRVAAAIQPAHYRYWHTTGTVGTLGAAAAVGSLLRLDGTGLAHALANATSMAAGLQQAFRSDAMTKPLHAGHAAEAGALAALAAEQGFTGALDILDGDAGFGAAMSDGPDWGTVFADLGRCWNVTQMTFKDHACCGHTFAAIDGALELRARHGIAPESVCAVEVETYRTALDVAGNSAPATAFEAKFSIAYCVAAALIQGSVRLAAFDAERREDPLLQALLGRVDVRAADDLTRMFPGRRGARVALTTEDGTVLRSERPTRRGDPDLPLTDRELRDKYDELAGAAIGPEAAGELADRLWELESVAEAGALAVADRSRV